MLSNFLRLGIITLALLPAVPVLAQHEHPCAKTRLVTEQNRQLLQPVASVPHQKRMKQYDVSFYKLDIALERNSIYVAGNVTIQALTTVAAFDTFSFELHPDLAIDSLRLNGTLYPVQRTGGDANVVLAAALPAGVPVSANIYYKGTAPSGASAAIGNGLSTGNSGAWGNQVTWSLSEPFAAYEWWPCKQLLTDKADSVHVFVTTSADNKVGSNGLLTASVPMPNNKIRYEWKSNYPIAYYLISVAVAKYIDYSFYAHPAGADSVLIQNYIYDNPQTLPSFKNVIDQTGPMIELFSDKFGLYPFHAEKYGHAMAPFSGGMEHQTMTSLGFFDFGLVAHELGHQWFGDHVTCAGWAHIWLNEGFASYSEYVALQNMVSAAAARSWMDDTHASVMSQNGGQLFVVDSTNVSRIFSSRLTYDKGATVAHMLRFQVNNDSLYFAILRAYLNQYGNGTATTENLQQVFETMTGQNYGDFFGQWVYGQGFPTFNLRWNQVGNQFVLRSTQAVSMASATPLFKTPIEYRLTRAIGDTTIRVFHGQQIENYTFPVGGTVTGISVDPNQWILNKAGSTIKDTSLGINAAAVELAAAPVQAMPNPFRNTLKLSNLPLGASVQVLDVLGRSVLQQTTSQSEINLSTAALPGGVYVVKITAGEALQTLRVVKQ